MKPKILPSKTQFYLIIIFFVIQLLPLSMRAEGKKDPLPYRFLAVISDQWKDPASYLVEGNNEFKILVTLLKNWGLPFDILRLDQEKVDGYHMLDREGNPRYGTIILDTDLKGMKGKDLSLLPSLVKDRGVNLVILGNTVALPEVSALAGVTYISEYQLDAELAITGEHFITRTLNGREREFNDKIDYYTLGSKVNVLDAEVLAKRAHLPFLTVRQFENGGRVVWLGADQSENHITIQLIRDMLKRSLVWANGYALYAEYPQSVVLFMDDFGTSDRTFLPYWHYRTLNENDIRTGIIEPLKKHKAVLNEDVITGFVDRKTRQVINPWKQKVIDEIDGKTVHDYISAKRGLDAGLREGVLEIQCHGYTHMLPDLESPPGPFWTAPMDGVGSLDFYYEFGDPLRDSEIPAITQKFILGRGLEYIKNDFGVTPLFVINGGGAISYTYPNNNSRIAAEMGFGVSHFNYPGYLGRDIVIPSMEPVVIRQSWDYKTDLTDANVPWTIDGPFFIVFHDRDISMDNTALERLLTNLGKQTRYLSANEYCGYLHTQIELNKDTGGPLSLALNYDDHYCRYFKSHKSTWTLHLADDIRAGFEKSVPEKQIITVPEGLGRHIVNVAPSTK